MDYCLICLQRFGRLIRAHEQRNYTITPLGRAALAGMRAEKVRAA